MTQLPKQTHRLIDGANYAHLATVLNDGAPHSVPLWVGLVGERIAFLTSPASCKARNIGRDPRVAISITDRNQPFTMAHIRGRVTQRLDGDDAWEVIDRISDKYTGQPYPMRTNRVVFLVEPEHVAENSYG